MCCTCGVGLLMSRHKAIEGAPSNFGQQTCRRRAGSLREPTGYPDMTLSATDRILGHGTRTPSLQVAKQVVEGGQTNNSVGDVRLR